MADFRTIPLTQGQVAIVDAEDYERLSKHKWHAWKDPHSGSYYAARNVMVNGRRTTIMMHREIMNNPPGKDVDHRERITLDNRKGTSLRLGTHSQNLCNQKKNTRNSSGFKGVSFNARRGKWHAYVNVRKKRTNIGYFNTAEAAFEARKATAEGLHGEFARVA